MASSPSPESTPSAATPPPSSATPPPSSATAPPPTTASPPPVPAATPPPSNDVPPPLVTPPQVAAPPPQPTKPPESSPSPPSGRPESSPPPSVSPQPPERSPSPPDKSPPPVPGNPGNPTPKPPVVPSPELPPQAPPLSPGGNSSSPGGRNSSSSPVSGPPGNTSPSQPPQTVLSPPSVQFPPPRSSGDSPPSSQSPVTPSDRPSARETSKSKDDGGLAGGALAIGLVVGVVVLAIVGVAFWILCNRRRRRKRPDPDGGYFMPLSRRSGFNGGFVIPASHGSVTPPDVTHSKAQSSALITGRHSGISDFVYSSSESGGSRNSGPWFTYEELYKATNGFSAHNLLGEGGFGSVYKGYLPDGRVVAVKHLKVGGGQGEREFKAEVEIISRVHHRHLVSLVGYCISQDQRLLVYDYVPNNTLYFHLHGKGRPVLDWEIRVKVAAGAARGIAYLHEDCHPRIVHRDIKSSNILLDDNFEARVADFGLAKLFIDANTHVTTRVMGTFGYMAPEYASSGKLTEKSDVFSYGVLLLELITGRKPVDTSQPSGNESLVEWARPSLSHVLETEDFEGLIDPKLGKNYAKSEVLRMIEAAAACVRHSAAKRPRMGQIVRTFDTLATSDLSNGLRPGESEIHNGAPQSTLVRLFERMVQGGQDSSSGFFSGGVSDTRGSL